MSQNAHEGAQSTTGEGQTNSGESTGASIQELQDQMAALKASNDRLLKESKDWKTKAQSYGSQAEELERAEAEKSKNHQKLVEIERKRVAELQAKLKSRDESTLQANLKAAVLKAAPDVIDVEDVMNQPKYLPLLQAGVDMDSLSVTDEAVKHFVSTLQKDKAHLFKKGKAPATFTKVPNGRTTGMQFESSEDMKDKSNQELVAIALGLN
jgi:hypothetical protein